MRGRLWSAVLLAGLAAAAAFAGPANSETISVICEDADTQNPYPPMPLHFDLSAGTADYHGADSSYRVPARISERSIDWIWGANRFSLDRTSGIMNRLVDGRYTSTWRCRKLTGSAI